MTNYLILIVTASFFCTLINSLLSEKGAGKTARAVVNVVMLCVVIMPIIKSLSHFSDNLALPVINEETSHIIDNKENDIKTYREWLAKTTATQLSEDIENSVKNGIGIKVRVECPWHFSNESIVFDKLRIYTASDKRYYESIKNYVKLHYSLDSECFEEVE